MKGTMEKKERSGMNLGGQNDLAGGGRDMRKASAISIQYIPEVFGRLYDHH
jgi:hypothetical protein